MNASSRKRNGRNSAIHHAAAVTNVIPDFCFLAYDWGFGRNELDGLEGKIMKFTSRLLRIPDNPWKSTKPERTLSPHG